MGVQDIHLIRYEHNLSVNDGYTIAIHAIGAAIRRNAGTGDGVNGVIIDKDGYRDFLVNGYLVRLRTR